jgi:hypothetical protein
MRSKVNLKNALYLIAALLFTTNTAFAQSDLVKEAITYEELYDDPYAINKLFIHLQPLYAELFATNVNAGFGIAGNYLYKDKADFFANFRHAYARSTDFVRDIAYKNSSVANKPNSFIYMELGGTYHIKDEESDTETKMILYSKRYQKGNRWSSQVPEHTIIPSKVRKVIGARLGGFAYSTSIDLKRIATDQEIILEDEIGAFPSDLYSHSNQSVKGAFIGGSYSWIKNMAIKPDKGYGILSDDLLLTTFLDIMFAPSIVIDDIQYRDPVTTQMRTFSTQDVETKKIGFRLGLEGKYNRELSWAYGAEIGARPSVSGKGFFALIKISLPVYSTNLDYGREAFGK